MGITGMEKLSNWSKLVEGEFPFSEGRPLWFSSLSSFLCSVCSLLDDQHDQIPTNRLPCVLPNVAEVLGMAWFALPPPFIHFLDGNGSPNHLLEGKNHPGIIKGNGKGWFCVSFLSHFLTTVAVRAGGWITSLRLQVLISSSLFSINGVQDRGGDFQSFANEGRHLGAQWFSVGNEHLNGPLCLWKPSPLELASSWKKPWCALVPVTFIRRRKSF